MADILDIIANVILDGLDKAVSSKNMFFRISFIVIFNIFVLGMMCGSVYVIITTIKKQLFISIIFLAIFLIFLVLYLYFINLLKSKK